MIAGLAFHLFSSWPAGGDPAATRTPIGWRSWARDGSLLYRWVRLHSRAGERPRAGTVAMSEDQVVWVQAHMNTTGIGGEAFQGSFRDGISRWDFHPGFAGQDPLLVDCDF